MFIEVARKFLLKPRVNGKTFICQRLYCRTHFNALIDRDLLF